MAPPKKTGGTKRAGAGSRASSGAIQVRARNIRSSILKKIASEVGKAPKRAAVRARGTNTHIKTDTTDLHGKGHHIKGAGPNYLKDA